MENLNRLKSKHRSQYGFTLIEVVVVLAMIGLILATVRYTVFTGSIKNEIEKEAMRLQVVFNMASDFAVINQLELGLRIDDEKQTYEFVMLDEDDKWVTIDTHKHFAQVTFSEGVFVELILEGLEWQNDESLFDNRIFDEQLSVSNEGVQIGNEEDIPPPPPQILILSSGEITPFELLIRYEPQDLGDDEFEFSLLGKETVPIELATPE